MIEPFIEVDVLENADDIADFFEENGYDSEDIYAVIVSDEDCYGYSAEFHLFEDDELVVVSASWQTELELRKILRETLGTDFEIKDS